MSKLTLISTTSLCLLTYSLFCRAAPPMSSILTVSGTVEENTCEIGTSRIELGTIFLHEIAETKTITKSLEPIALLEKCSPNRKVRINVPIKDGKLLSTQCVSVFDHSDPTACTLTVNWFTSGILEMDNDGFSMVADAQGTITVPLFSYSDSNPLKNNPTEGAFSATYNFVYEYS